MSRRVFGRLGPGNVSSVPRFRVAVFVHDLVRAIAHPPVHRAAQRIARGRHEHRTDRLMDLLQRHAPSCRLVLQEAQPRWPAQPGWPEFARFAALIGPRDAIERARLFCAPHCVEALRSHEGGTLTGSDLRRLLAPVVVGRHPLLAIYDAGFAESPRGVARRLQERGITTGDDEGSLRLRSQANAGACAASDGVLPFAARLGAVRLRPHRRRLGTR